LYWLGASATHMFKICYDFGYQKAQIISHSMASYRETDRERERERECV